MTRGLQRTLRIAALLALAIALIAPAGAQAAGASPAAQAESIRESMFAAQMALGDDPAAAGQSLEQARAAYAGDFGDTLRAADPEAGGRITAGFADAAAALSAGEQPAFSAAAAQVWTGILAGGYVVVTRALRQGDGQAAQEWLSVREFRTTTRFSHPSADATLAVAGFVQGTTGADEALAAVQADLLDTYQARLTETLHDLGGSDVQGYPTRRAGLAGDARGYFQILAPAYAQAQGDAALASAQAAFDGLQAAALSGQGIGPALDQVDALLKNFRAAPLSPEEQARRAGQMLSFLGLVPVEYGRGISGTQVTHDFEIQEAVTFNEGALAAFTDLEDLLDRRDPDGAARAKAMFAALEQQLDDAGQGGPVAGVDAVSAQVDSLTGLLRSISPAEWLQQTGQGDFAVIASMLDQMQAAVAVGDYQAAESARLEAYAILESGPEARLMAFAPQLRLQLEDYFWNGQGTYKGLYYLIAQGASAAEIQASRSQLDAALQDAQARLGANTAPGAVAANAGMIVFREGLEAVIILASLMSSMKREEERRYRKPMWWGVAASLLATGLTWMLAHDVLRSLAQYGEKLEAVVSLIAIGVLLLIMNWFFHKLYWTGWIANFHSRKRRLLSGESGLWLGLIVLGFTTVYREGFETVLFLQALVLESGVQVVLLGVAAALAAVALVGFATFRLQVNLPYKKMLVVTGVLIGAVLLQMVGNTVHILQVVGWLPIHLAATLPIWLGTWLGVYGTWEGLGLQAAAGAFVIGSYYLAEWSVHRRSRKGAQRRDAEENRLEEGGPFARPASPPEAAHQRR